MLKVSNGYLMELHGWAMHILGVQQKVGKRLRNSNS